MRKISLFLILSMLIIVGCNTQDSELRRSSNLPFLIEVDPLLLSSSKLNEKEVVDLILNAFEKHGKVISLNLKEFGEKKLENIQAKNNLGDVTIAALPLYEGPPGSFSKELSVIRLDLRFFGTRPAIFNNQNNRWDEERFLQIFNNIQEDTERVKRDMNAIIDDFFEWFSKRFPGQEIIFYVADSEAVSQNLTK